MHFLYLNDGIYFHSSYAGEKMEHIKADPRVVFEVERDVGYLPAKGDPCWASFAYSCVIIHGRADLVESADEKIEILGALMSKYQPDGGYGQFNEKMVEKTAVVKIVVESVTGKTSPAK
ncbi:MAG TPA: pyridoxamine 5'-phosphate oxidase family protein [Nitrospirae bacterium]|nr:pyridoxamine 5'-phosphate oxidase family protein [Nitrospirota bacterium]